MTSWEDQNEWLETDGLGGFASGTAGGIRTRRYHGLLLTAQNPPDSRFMLVNGLEMFATFAGRVFPLSSQRYAGQTIHPEGFRLIESFTTEPWPRWTFLLPGGTRIVQEICMRDESPTVGICWRVQGPKTDVSLLVRPLLSGRDYHSLHYENGALRFDAAVSGDLVTWQTYPSVPPVIARSNGAYQHDPAWYRNFFYQEEWLRGFDATEDLASPGTFRWDLGAEPAVLLLTTEPLGEAARADTAAAAWLRMAQAEHARRELFPTALHRAASQYSVRRGRGRTIIAGYPWFVDWGRDSFGALRGLCLATHQLERALEVLLAWAGFVSEGMLPNRFPDGRAAPEYDSVDAALWYVVAVYEFLKCAERAQWAIGHRDRQVLRAATHAILSSYARGTRYRICADRDGLLAAGEPGVQLTWMNARVGDWVVTPRIGKPVEVQALWLNALYLATTDDPQWEKLCAIGCANFRERFWNETAGCLFDVIDCDHIRGQVDPSLRPNQIFAVGGLPLVLLGAEQARSVVDRVEKHLCTPLGLRSLAPGEHGYIPHYNGDARERDMAYHQGSAWPWLAGAFIEAWTRVRGRTPAATIDARLRFVDPLLRHLCMAGLGHVSEIADGDAPYMPRGCPFQAWSVGELLRIQAVLDDRAADTAFHPRQRPTMAN